MDSYRFRLQHSDLTPNKPSSSPSSLFSQLIRYIQEKYAERIQRLEQHFEDFKSNLSSDAALKAMRDNPITEKYIDSRISELFHSSILTENEQTISLLQSELMNKKSEIIKLEQQIHVIRLDLEKSEDRMRDSGLRESMLASGESYKELWDREKRKSEAIEAEMRAMQRDIEKTRDIFEENQKLQRYCEQLETEREEFSESCSRNNEVKTMMEAQKRAGFETVKEIQDEFKKKSRAMKRKIVEQKALIEEIHGELEKSRREVGGGLIKSAMNNSGSSEVKAYYEKREAEIVEKHKTQIMNLQNQFQGLLEAKIKEITSQLDPKFKGRNISENEYLEVCRQKKELEAQILHLKNCKERSIENPQIKIYEERIAELESNIFLMKTQQELNDFKKKPMNNEKYEEEVMLHNETKKKLRQTEEILMSQSQRIKDLEYHNKNFKDLIAKENQKQKIFEESSRLSASQLFKHRDLVFLMRSSMKNLRIFVQESISGLNSLMFSKFKEIVPKILLKSKELNAVKINNLIAENKSLSSLLRGNSEAFDRLQEEVKVESSRFKQKSQKKIEKALKKYSEKHQGEIDELKAEIYSNKVLLEKAEHTISVDSHLKRQLKEEIEGLRNEKETIRKKQQILEEKILTQNNNFKLQILSKQQEIDLLKKKPSN